MLFSIVILVILIGINAFFASSEIAFISLNDAKIEKQAKDGDKKAKSIQNMLKDPSKFLATIQIGVTLAGFLSSAFAADTFAEVLSPKLYNLMPFIQEQTWRAISIILITLILSYFTLVFGELVPKRLAMKYTEKIAFSSVGIIKAISVVASPFVKLLTLSTNAVSKIFKITENEEEVVTEEEIRMMIDVGEEKGVIGVAAKEMLNNVFEFNDKIVSEIMVPRTEVFALDKELTIKEVIDILSEDTRYSRVPVYEETIDNIVGIVYIKDILLSKKDENRKIKELMKKAYYVPETITVDKLFEEMRKNKKQISIVIEEHGGTSGIVTMEDILEEIVGEIYDEYDTSENKVVELDSNTYLIDGSLAIYDLEKIFDIEIPEGDYDTISGYLIDLLGRIPKPKENIIIETEQLDFKVEKVKNKKIVQVKVCKK
jgi:putative hemolysin